MNQNNNNGNGSNNNNMGYQQPRHESHTGSFDNRGPATPPTSEQMLGQPDYSLAEPGRVEYPEDSNAEWARVSPFVTQRRAMNQIPCAIPIQGRFVVERADYNFVANNQYVRDGAAVVGALGRNDQDAQSGVAGSGDTAALFTIQPSAAPNYVLGYVLEWSLQLQISSALTMKVWTERFKGDCIQPVDRKFDLRIGGGNDVSSAAGGIFAFLFAQRLDANYACGYASANTSMAAAGYGGMTKAIAQPARLVPFVQTSVVVGEGSGPATIFVPGNSLNAPADAPAIYVQVPTALAAGFGVLARPITAASPHLALVRAALGLDSMPRAA